MDKCKVKRLLHSLGATEEEVDLALSHAPSEDGKIDFESFIDWLLIRVDDLVLPGPQPGRQPWVKNFDPFHQVGSVKEGMPEVETPDSCVKMILTDSGTLSVSARSHLTAMSELAGLSSDTSGIMLWIVDAQSCRNCEARAKWLSDYRLDALYYAYTYPKLKQIRLMMCPMHSWDGKNELPAPCIRPVCLSAFLDWQSDSKDELLRNEAHAEGQPEEISLATLSDMLEDAKLIFGMGGNPWTLKWAFKQSEAGKLVLKKIIAGDAIYVGDNAGMMTMSRWIGRLTGDSKYYDPGTGAEAAPDGSTPGCIDISCGSDEGLGIFPVNCCFRPHCTVDKSDGVLKKITRIEHFASDHDDVNTTVVLTRCECYEFTGDLVSAGGDAIAYYNGKVHWVEIDQ